MTESLPGYRPKKTEQNLIVRIDNSEAELTNNKSALEDREASLFAQKEQQGRKQTITSNKTTNKH